MARGLADMFDGKRLRRARAAAEDGRGISAEALARRIDATKAQVLAYENGLVRPDPRRIQDLAQALGIEPLQLSDTSGARTWTMSDLRRAHGLRAEDVSRTLGLSLRTYRRLENEGLVPAHRFNLMSELAELFAIGTHEVEEHLCRAPLLSQRLDDVREPLACTLSFYLQPRNLERPGPGDDEIVALAGLYRRSPLTLARIVGHEIARLRGMLRRQLRFEAVASYGATAEEQAKGQAAAQAEGRKIREVMDALPHNLDTFFRSMLPLEAWRTIALFHALRPLGGWLSTGQLNAKSEQLAMIPAQLLERRTTGKDAAKAEYRISEQGAKHCAAYRPWYDACYPAVQALVQVNERALAGHMQQSDLHDLLAQSDAVLFSFDGLLCRLFGRDLQTVSERLLSGAQSLQMVLPPQTPTDPVGMLRALVRHGTPGQIKQLDRLLTQCETEAARHVTPLPGVSQLLRALADSPRRLAVVTDHASDAVHVFLERLPADIPPGRIAVVGRPDDPELMKPNPHGLARATAALNARHARVLLVGESIADALAAQTARIPFVGVAATTRQARMLRDAGASRTVASVRTITAVVKEQQAGA
ncbi:HAD hydrolase-like protein [Streptomyces sp. Tu 4128]|uniref:HAD hydrolase-like protein n=1 Tax=Streptomyces sp. Tu 4128 TaxID=1120314 RepID=UPI000F01E9DA|nr:HAD hydrolase-like protein [Streptomyces sp. Tu 4128]